MVNPLFNQLQVIIKGKSLGDGCMLINSWVKDNHLRFNLRLASHSTASAVQCSLIIAPDIAHVLDLLPYCIQFGVVGFARLGKWLLL